MSVTLPSTPDKIWQKIVCACQPANRTDVRAWGLSLRLGPLSYGHRHHHHHWITWSVRLGSGTLECPWSVIYVFFDLDRLNLKFLKKKHHKNNANRIDELWRCNFMASAMAESKDDRKNKNACLKYEASPSGPDQAILLFFIWPTVIKPAIVTMSPGFSRNGARSHSLSLLLQFLTVYW